MNVREVKITYLPNITAKLDELMIEVEIFCVGPFMTLFSNTMEGDALYRVWDIILAEQDGEGEMKGAQSGVLLFRYAESGRRHCCMHPTYHDTRTTLCTYANALLQHTVLHYTNRALSAAEGGWG